MRMGGNLTMEFEVLGKIDDRHAALAQVALDVVAVGEGASAYLADISSESRAPSAELRS